MGGDKNGKGADKGKGKGSHEVRIKPVIGMGALPSLLDLSEEEIGACVTGFRDKSWRGDEPHWAHLESLALSAITKKAKRELEILKGEVSELNKISPAELRRRLRTYPEDEMTIAKLPMRQYADHQKVQLTLILMGRLRDREDDNRPGGCRNEPERETLMKMVEDLRADRERDAQKISQARKREADAMADKIRAEGEARELKRRKFDNDVEDYDRRMQAAEDDKKAKARVEKEAAKAAARKKSEDDAVEAIETELKARDQDEKARQKIEAELKAQNYKQDCAKKVEEELKARENKVSPVAEPQPEQNFGSPDSHASQVPAVMEVTLAPAEVTLLCSCCDDGQYTGLAGQQTARCHLCDGEWR